MNPYYQFKNVLICSWFMRISSCLIIGHCAICGCKPYVHLNRDAFVYIIILLILIFYSILHILV